MPILDTKDVPYGEEIAIGMCAKPECSKVHIVLFDETGKPIATAGIEDVKGFTEAMRDIACVAATRRTG